jgi:penicillin-binding protein 2
VLVEHGGFGAQAAVPRAREIMKVALLKDPEVRARIETALPQTSPKPPSMTSSAAEGQIDAVPPDLPPTPVIPDSN